MKSMWGYRIPCFGLVIILTTFLMQSCGILPIHTSDTIHTYILSADIPTPTQSRKAGAGTLLVNLPGAHSGFNTQGMVYVKRNDEVSYFTVNQWAETPSHMLLPLLVSALERTNLWDAVVQMPSPVRGDYQLTSENLLLQQEFTQEPSRVRMHLRLQLLELKNFQVLATREFTVLENAKSNDPYGGVQAANIATERLLQDISEWLSRCLEASLVGKC